MDEELDEFETFQEMISKEKSRRIQMRKQWLMVRVWTQLPKNLMKSLIKKKSILQKFWLMRWLIWWLLLRWLMRQRPPVSVSEHKESIPHQEAVKWSMLVNW
jgi:hypothetical protein